MRLRRCLLPVALLAAAGAARAEEGPGEFLNEYEVNSPYVVGGETEVEMRATQYRDSSLVLDQGRGYVLSFAHAFTDWWRPEVYVGKWLREPRQPADLVGYEFENTFQLTTRGEYWADAGFLFAYEYATHEGEPNALEFGPLFERDSDRIRQRLNLIWEKQLGSLKEETGYELRASYAANYLWSPKFSPGIEVFARDVFWQAGPAFSGEIHFGRSEFEYDAGLVFGLSASAPDATLLLRLEYEFF
ncbi:MAG TPA: hypothetical protein VF651_06245 [Gammaproteobacteria bacterium]